MKKQIIYQSILFTASIGLILSCQKENPLPNEMVINSPDITGYQPGNTTSASMSTKSTRTNVKNDKTDEPDLRWLWNLEDVECPKSGPNCGDPVVIDGVALSGFKDAVDGDETDVKDFFDNALNWNSIFPWLDNATWSTPLEKLQSGKYDLEDYHNDGTDYYEASYNGDAFVIQIVEE